MADQIQLMVGLEQESDDEASGMGPSITPQPVRAASTDWTLQTPLPVWTSLDCDVMEMDEHMDALDGCRIRFGFNPYKEFNQESLFYGSSISDWKKKAGYMPYQLNGIETDCLSQAHYDTFCLQGRTEEEVKGEGKEEAPLGAFSSLLSCDSWEAASVGTSNKFLSAYWTCEANLRQSTDETISGLLSPLSYTSEIVRAISECQHPDEWLIDLGATLHFMPYKSDFVMYQLLDKPLSVDIANDSKILIPGWGTVLLETLVKRSKGKLFRVRLELSPVFHMEGGKYCLISQTKICHDGIRAIDDGNSTILMHQNVQILEAMPRPDKHKSLHCIQTCVIQLVEMTAIISERKPALYYQLHQRMGHPSDRVMRHLWENVTGLNAENKLALMPLYCKGCIKGNTIQVHHPDDPT
jgi:hypothetical protein